jgi:hypothetical protein
MLLEGVRAALAWASRGYDTVYSAGWAELKPAMSYEELGAAAGGEDASGKVLVIGRPESGVDASTYLQTDTEAECASARAAWATIQHRFEMIKLPEMFAKPAADEPTLPEAEGSAPADDDAASAPAAAATEAVSHVDDEDEDDDFDAADLASLLE